MYRKKRDFMVYKTRTFLLCHLGHSEREREREYFKILYYPKIPKPNKTLAFFRIIAVIRYIS